MRKKQLIGILLSLVMVLGLMPGMGLTALAWDGDPYAALLNTTTAVNFDGKEWYLIENNSTATNAGTVTLLSKDCVGASQYNMFSVSSKYEGSTVETFVNTYYDNCISSDVKSAVADNKMFLLTKEQAKAMTADTRECFDYSGWWLCSPYRIDGYVAYVGANGQVYTEPGSLVSSTYGVRPALKLNLSSVIFSSETNTFTVGSAKTDPTVTAPTAKTLTYTGSAQELVNAGSATGGTMYYAVTTTNTEPTDESLYTTEIPAKTEVGTYYVWYRVKGDKNHKDTGAAGPITVQIEKADHVDEAVSVELKYGRTKEIDISQYIEAGGYEGTVNLSDNDRVLDGTPSINGSHILSITAADDAGNAGKTALITVPVSGSDYYNSYDIKLTVTIVKKYTQTLSFAESEVSVKAGESIENELTGAQTEVSYKSSDEKVATVDGNGRVTGISEGSATITAEAAETEDYFGVGAEYKVNVTDTAVKKVPLSDAGDSYAAPEDNIAPTGTSTGNIKKLQLDFSNVKESGVDPADLKMTAINGTKLTTKGKLKDKDSVKTTGGIKAKVDKKTLIATITCKKDGSAAFTMEDGSTYTISFTVQKPKAQKSAKSISKGSSTVIKTINELFGTDIDAGDLTVQKQKHSQAKVSDNSLYIDPKEKDSIKLQYKYLNKKYKLTMKVK